MLVKLVTPKAYFFAFLSSKLVGCARYCKSGSLKYWTKAHFCKPISLYHSGLRPLSFEKVKMKKDLCPWYQGPDYEEDLVLTKYPLLSERKRRLIFVISYVCLMFFIYFKSGIASFEIFKKIL